VIDDYSLVQSLSKIAIGQERVQNIAAWEKPNVGCFKVNWDVEMDQPLDQFGMGMVIRDSNG
jgi:hypothetical protein